MILLRQWVIFFLKHARDIPTTKLLVIMLNNKVTGGPPVFEAASKATGIELSTSLLPIDARPHSDEHNWLYCATPKVGHQRELADAQHQLTLCPLQPFLPRTAGTALL
jgi:hypothetical protein